MKRRLLVLLIGVAALFVSAAPALADFDITAGTADTTWDGTTFTFSRTNVDFCSTSANLYGGGTSAAFVWPDFGTDGNLNITMKVTSIVTSPTGGSAVGTNGNFLFEDIYGAQIVGSFGGTWAKGVMDSVTGVSTVTKFTGVANLSFTPTSGYGTLFTGQNDAVDMSTFVNGQLRSITLDLGPGHQDWFNANFSTGPSGTLNVVPIPGAVLLGFLGLSAAGLGLRKLS